MTQKAGHANYYLGTIYNNDNNIVEAIVGPQTAAQFEQGVLSKTVLSCRSNAPVTCDPDHEEDGTIVYSVYTQLQRLIFGCAFFACNLPKSLCARALDQHVHIDTFFPAAAQLFVK